MIYTIQPPQHIDGPVGLPASKSISNRVLILNALSKSPYPIANLSDSDDTKVLQKALESNVSDFDIGAAGTSMRFLTAYLSQLSGNWTLTGTERMKNRPIKILVEALRAIGGEISYIDKEGFPPLRIQGKNLKGGSIRLDGSVSSQYISALMLIAPCLAQGLCIRLTGDIISKPYIEMTLRLMQVFGMETFWDGKNIRIAPQNYRPLPFQVESDWSAASYWYEMVLLFGKSKIELIGLENNSLQGDAKIAEIYEKFGIKTEFQPGKIVLSNCADIPASTAIHKTLLYDFTNEPDTAQTLAVSCCLSDIPFRFIGLQSLRIKETDRILALQTELKKLGYVVKAGTADMEWVGERCRPDLEPLIFTYEDHRMAMAFAPVCLKTGKIRIKDPEVVSKSYPGFWSELKKMGFSITEI
ncbi:MAG: 3-phosphoshikimate 1-carboxyvinyltransferase [Dysgonamonadaceae bacterium]|jgi:3-phosphoshikimate 1-carboxyvinyltransferase|nr:3-phosphoshikimate 1-carboxyvinyltransferase [Dysgonamonadaceae bacterium]